MIIAVAGWRGTGATTAALALAVCLGTEQRPSWLVEADPAGGVLSGRVRLVPGSVGGLEQVAFPLDAQPAADRLSAVAQRCGDVMIVSAPTDPFRAHACHRPRSPWLAGLTDLGADVVVDVGRIRSSTPAWPILVAADSVLLVTSSEIAAVVSGCEWLQAAGRTAAGEPGLDEGAGRLLVVDAPGGPTFTRDGLRREIGADLCGWIPWEPATVDLLHRGAAADDRRLRRSALLAAARGVVVDLDPGRTATPERVG